MSAETRAGWGHSTVALGGPWALSLPKAQAVGGLIFKTHSVDCAADGNQSEGQCGLPGPGLPGPGLPLSRTPHAFQHREAAGRMGF